MGRDSKAETLRQANHHTYLDRLVLRVVLGLPFVAGLTTPQTASPTMMATIRRVGKDTDIPTVFLFPKSSRQRERPSSYSPAQEIRTNLTW